MATLTNPQTLLLSHPHPETLPISSRPQTLLSFPLRRTPRPLLRHRPIALSALSPPSPLPLQTAPKPSPLDSGPTRTLAALFALAVAAARRLLAPSAAAAAGALSASGPLFFAALRDRPSGYLNTPLTVVAAGLAKWLDIYSGVLMVRVLLSWFPNIPWDRQPLSAIRDLCDPYLNLFRNIIPPVFDTLDVSPLLAFAVLGTLGSILSSSRGL